MAIKVPLFNIDTVHTTLLNVAKTFIDPLTIPTEEDDPDATILFTDTRKSLPARTELISVFSGVKGICYIKNIEQLQSSHMNAKNDKAVITGAIIILISGHDETTETKAKHYGDIVAGYLENEDLLGIAGCKIYPIDGNPLNWEILDMLNNENMPLLNTFAVVGFKIIKSRGNPITIPES